MSDPYVSDGDEIEGDLPIDDADAPGAVGGIDADEPAVVDDDGDLGEGEVVMVLEEVDDALVLPMWEPTGEERVDEALELLSTLDVDDVHQHAAVFSEIHEKLRATLSTADAPID